MAVPSVAAIFAEYPFLGNHILLGPLTSGKVQRWDEELLNRRPNKFYSEHTISNPVYLFDERGNLLQRVGIVPRRWWQFSDSISDETVGECLIRIGNRASEVYYAAVIDYGGKFLFYKLPTGSTDAKAWFDERTRSEREKLHQQSA